MGLIILKLVVVIRKSLVTSDENQYRTLSKPIAKRSSLNPQVHSLLSVSHSLNNQSPVTVTTNRFQVWSLIDWAIVIITITSKRQVLKNVTGPYSLYVGS